MASPSIRSIAQHLGLSKSTVAGALREQRGYSSSTIAKVRKAACELGYRPNPLVTACMTRIRDGSLAGSVQTFAYLSEIPWQLLNQQPDQMNSYLGAKARAAELGFSIDFLSPQRRATSTNRLQDILQARGISGLILAPTDNPHTFNLQWEQFAAVSIGSYLKSPRFDSVSYDYYAAITDLCERMRDAGYRRLGLAVTANSDVQAGHAVRAGFLRWQADSVADANAIPVSFAMNGPRLREWVDTHHPDCVIAFGQNALITLRQFPRSGPEIVSLSLTRGFESMGGFDLSSQFISARAVELLATKLYRNDFGTCEKRQSQLFLGRWNQPYEFERNCSRENIERHPVLAASA